MKNRLIPALDFDEGQEALDWIQRLRFRLTLFKIGLRLFVKEGPSLIRNAGDAGVKIFLDLKLHDIPSTVEGAARAAAQLPVEMLTVHASGGREMIRAAVRGVEGKVKVLAVTVLTSLSEKDQREIFGSGQDGKERIVSWASMAMAEGAAGVVCSPWEAEAIHEADLRNGDGKPPLIVTPGVRLCGQQAGKDQSRVSSPGDAIRAGATHLVVGRPIFQSKNPEEEVDRFLEEMRHGAE